MFEYSKIKAELEQVECPLHGKFATVTFTDGKVKLDNICCPEHQRKLAEVMPEIEDHPNEGEMMEEVLYA